MGPLAEDFVDYRTRAVSDEQEVTITLCYRQSFDTCKPAITPAYCPGGHESRRIAGKPAGPLLGF
jgi:hypothetical protein